MQRRRRKLSFVLWFAALFGPLFCSLLPPLAAVERRLELDSVTSRVRFEVQATAHVVRGIFRVRAGEVRFDDETGSASGEIVVDTATADSGNASRDRKMRDTVLEVGKFPEARLLVDGVSGRLAASGISELQLLGRLRLHGGEHRVTVPLRVTVEGEKVRAEGTFAVPFIAWGLADPSVFVLRVEPVVQVTVDARGLLVR
jgi:polyisoprenoid-binding protein YceI